MIKVNNSLWNENLTEQYQSIKSSSYEGWKNNISPDFNTHAKDTFSWSIILTIHARNHINLQTDLKNSFLHSVMSR